MDRGRIDRGKIIGRAMLWGCAVFFGGLPAIDAADEFEATPIEYSRSTPENAVTQLQSRIKRGEVELKYEEDFGYLRSLLQALEIPEESQMLVFSKTSLQRNRIAPETPRAIYFNDDLYLGYCHNGDALEVSVADPKLGAVFYTLDQREQKSPFLLRETDNCLSCHGGSQTDNIPGHLVRSVFTNERGLPLLSEGSHRVDHTTPFSDRWGGWYVSGTHGSQSHLGNLIVREEPLQRPVNNAAGQNVTDLSGFVPHGRYLTEHSDIVALMVLEHQVLVHNRMTRAGFSARQALHYEADINRALGEAEGTRRDSTTSRIRNAGNKLIAALLFVDEAPLTAPVAGTSEFAETFSKRGPRDSQGRSLRDFDLKTRMFRYPCSFLIYSPSYDGLPLAMRQYVGETLRQILTAEEPDPAYAHLSPEDRRAIFEILSETKPDLWNPSKD